MASSPKIFDPHSTVTARVEQLLVKVPGVVQICKKVNLERRSASVNIACVFKRQGGSGECVLVNKCNTWYRVRLLNRKVSGNICDRDKV